MKRVSFALFVVLCAFQLSISAASAAWVKAGDGSGVGVNVLESSASRIALEFTLGGFERQDVNIEGRTYSRITLPGEAVHLDKGMPELPLVARSVIIPDDRRMVLHVIATDYVDVAGIDVAPSKGDLLRTVDPDQVPYTFGPFYQGAGWYPEEQAATRDPYILRDYRGMTVLVDPIQYQPAGHTVRVYTRILLELVDAGPGGPNVLVPNGGGEIPEFSEIYRNHFLNYGMNTRYTQVGEVGSMLVIAYDSFAADVQPFVDWKNKMGVPTTLVLKSQVGTTAAQFQTYIQNAYNQSSDPRLAFVLLVGDAAQIPTPFASGGASDPTYSKVAGGDNYPDIFIGRFSAETVAQVQTQVARSVDYEESPLLVGGSWYPRGVGIGSEYGIGDDGEYDWQHIDNFRTMLLAYGYTLVDQLYGTMGATAAQVSAAVNAGRTIINYCGHGSMTSWGTTGFSNTNVNALTNDNMLPFIFSVACVNGQFDAGTCFAEAWLRATHNGAATGAVGFYGSSINQDWNPPMEAQDEFNRLLVTDAARTFGSLCYNGSCSMMDHYGSSGVNMFNTWHVFGDPSLRVRTLIPTNLSVNAPASIDPDATVFELDVPGVEDALCALSYQNQYLGSAFTDGGGHAVIPVTGTLPEGEDIDLTVTGYNRVPGFSTVRVEIPLVPLLTVDPDSIEVSMVNDSTAVDTLWISNQGEPGSVLNFTAAVHTGVIYPWMSVEPQSGSLAQGESMAIHVTLSPGSMHWGTYVGQVTFRYNPAQALSVPVTLHVDTPADVDAGRALPTVVELNAPSPNPFTGSALLRYSMPQAGPVRLAIYDSAGRILRVLAEGMEDAGYHSVSWDGRDAGGRSVATGVYFARLQAGERALSTRLMRVR